MRIELPRIMLKGAFSVDAMYYHAVKMNHDQAVAYAGAILQSEHDLEDLTQEEDKIEQDHEEDSMAAGDELEPIAIQIGGAAYALGESHGLFLQHIATTRVLCVASIESHINMRAADRLRRAAWQRF